MQTAHLIDYHSSCSDNIHQAKCSVLKSSSSQCGKCLYILRDFNYLIYSSLNKIKLIQSYCIPYASICVSKCHTHMLNAALLSLSKHSSIRTWFSWVKQFPMSLNSLNSAHKHKQDKLSRIQFGIYINNWSLIDNSNLMTLLTYPFFVCAYT